METFVTFLIISIPSIITFFIVYFIFFILNIIIVSRKKLKYLKKHPFNRIKFEWKSNLLYNKLFESLLISFKKIRFIEIDKQCKESGTIEAMTAPSLWNWWGDNILIVINKENNCVTLSSKPVKKTDIFDFGINLMKIDGVLTDFFQENGRCDKRMVKNRD